MPQYRKLATKTIESFDFNDLDDDFTRLTWVLLPLVACRDGRGIDMPTWLIGKLYPLRDDVTPHMIEAAMSSFAAHGMVTRYAVAGRPYFQIVNWARYQGATDKEAISPYPAPEQVDSYSIVSRELVASKSASDADADADADAVGEGGAIAPAPPLVIDPPTFQPVPETLKRQKARRGVVEATPAPPPAALALLHELTGYWPGDDNASLILASLGDNPDRSTLARAVELWRASGHKINNWLGICDWYQDILRDPAWTPQTRFKPKQGGANSAARPTVSTPEPGSQPVTW